MALASRQPIDWSAPLPGVLHGTSVSLASKGLLIIGPSGSGKSSLALQLMALGAALISDDLTQLTAKGGAVWLDSPGQAGSSHGIEARGLGVLNAQSGGSAPLCSIVDMSVVESSRLPTYHTALIAGFDVPYLKRVDNPAFPAMLVQYLSQGRRAPS